MDTLSPVKVRVFWQPGCSSCLRTKEFLTKQGVEFEAIDVHNDPQGMEQLLALGARSVPIVAVGNRYTFAQSMNDVIKFLGLKTKPLVPLPADQLVARLDLVLTAAARYMRQFTEEQGRVFFRDRKRTPSGLAYHVFRVAEMGLLAAQEHDLQAAGFKDAPPENWTTEDVARWGEDVRARLQAWWAGEPDKTLGYLVDTYFGRRPMLEVMERTAWHSAQHTRQLMLILETHGIQPDQPLTAADLAGLPLPDEVWDIREVQMH